MQVLDYLDIKKTEVKKIHGTKWQFQFRENGYVVISMCEQVKKKEVVTIVWKRHFHGVDVGSCLQYIYASNNHKGEYLNYDELESA